MVTVNRQEQILTVTDTTNEKRNISEAIQLLSPVDVPLLQRIGYQSLHFPCDQVKHEWMEDELTPSQWTLLSAYTAGSATMVFSSNAGKNCYVDDLILVGNNVCRILAINSDTVTISAGLGASTDASASAGATVRRIGNAAQEGAVARMDSRKTDIVMPYNYTQIMRDWCIVSGTMGVIQRYGYVSERAYQEAKILKRLAIQLEYNLLYGVRSYSAGPPRVSMMGGLAEYILFAGITNSWETVIDNASAELTEAKLNDCFQQIWELGGMPSLIVVNAWNKRVITKWATPRIRTSQPDSVGGGVIGTYESEFGTFEILLDRWVRPSDVIILSPEDVAVGPLNGRPFSSRPLPALGDYTQTELLGEYTAEVYRGKQAHGWIYDTSEA